METEWLLVWFGLPMAIKLLFRQALHELMTNSTPAKVQAPLVFLEKASNNLKVSVFEDQTNDNLSK